MGDPAPVPDIPAPFWRQLQKAPQKVLLLDYDGTLAPFQAKRDKAFPYPGIPEILQQIQLSGKTRLIIISGRSVADLLPLLGLDKFPEIWGSHGFERRLPDGSLQVRKIEPQTRQDLEEAYTRLKDRGYENDCEKKPSAIAFHWRRTAKNQRQHLEETIRNVWAPLTRNGTLQIRPFDGGLELRYVGFHKGRAVKQVLAECAGNAAVAYLGDDLTDEDAFKALKGRGLSVLVREESRRTEADCWLKPPAELLDFLKKWHRLS